VCGLDPLSELAAHLEQSIDQRGPLLKIHLRWLLKQRVRRLQEVVHLVLGLVLEHLGQQLSWRNVCIKFLLFALDGRALILENHCAAPLTILELYIVTYKGLAVDQSCAQVTRLINVIGVWAQR
jgi:hypothetical protein